MEGNEKCIQCKNSKRGICRAHFKELLERSADFIMRCRDCPIRDICDNAHKQENDLCILELGDSLDWSKKEEIEYLMQRLLDMERRLLIRKGREADRLGEQDSQRDFHKGMDTFMQHLEKYSKLKGWLEKPDFVESEERRKRTSKFLRSVFVRIGEKPQSKKEKVGVAEIQNVEPGRA